MTEKNRSFDGFRFTDPVSRDTDAESAIEELYIPGRKKTRS